MNRLNLIMIAGGLVVAAVAGAAGGQMRDKERAEAVAKFEITEADLPMMQACKTTLSSENLEFKTKVSKISACGCVAREVNDRINASDRAFAAEAFPVLVVAGVRGDKDSKALGEVVELVAKYKMDMSDIASATEAMLDAVGKCSAHDLYMSDEDKVEQADKARKQKENSRIAFDELVKDGHMTREEANRRLSRM